ncbi:MAG: inositol monophosphatase family protein, partial [Thermodesulfobacteriota bacterium]
ILAEEGSNHNNSDSSYKWIVDPLDGTMNYSHDYPFFCVSIGLEYENEIVLGVIFDPVRDEMFSAEKGKGATLNGEKITVSDTKLIEDSFVVSGTFYYHNDELMDKHLSILKKVNKKVRGVRRDGSACLNLCYVACGRFEAFWEYGLKPWDMAAGSLIIEEAGGKITRYDGSEFNIYSGEVLISNGLIHDEMVKICAAYL